MDSGTCALCHKTAPLCDSHIVPEFLYRDTYDEKHRARMLRSDNIRNVLLQKGIRERLLCRDCEQFINDNYEKPFNRMWFRSPGIPEIEEGQLVELTGLDYGAFKLFHLSILWRASVSTNHAFAEVSLGDRHSEAVREMILTGDPGPRFRYGILGALMLDPGSLNVCHSLIVGPSVSRIEGHRTYLIVYGGCAWNIVVSSHQQPNLFEHTLTEHGTLRLTYQEYTDYPPLKIIAASRRRNG